MVEINDEVESEMAEVTERTEKVEIFLLCDTIREVSYAIHKYLHRGHLEKVYENALAHRLRKMGLKVVHQYPIKVYDEDGTLLGNFIADLFVEDKLVLELKACATLTTDHYGQVNGYLRASKIEHGLLINFGSQKIEIKKMYQSLKP